MRRLFTRLVLSITFVTGIFPVGAPGREPKKSTPAKHGKALQEGGVLWHSPVDLESRDLFYGSGGKEQEPSGPFTFIEEDSSGTNPKIEVRDEHGVKWKVKLGEEARPETAASRFVWAAGYFTDDDYFVKTLKVRGLPKHLKRGNHLVAPDRSLQNVRLKRSPKGQEKLANWRWKQSPFTGTRELNGLRVLMALINNWDLKDENNAVYKRVGRAEPIYLVTDLGATFGTTGYILSKEGSRGNLHAYQQSKFISHVKPEHVDFNIPSRPTIFELANPPVYMRRVHLQWIGDHIPRTDAHWMGSLLGRLSVDQIRDAFRAAGYSRTEIDGFASVIRSRIAALKAL